MSSSNKSAAVARGGSLPPRCYVPVYFLHVHPWLKCSHRHVRQPPEPAPGGQLLLLAPQPYVVPPPMRRVGVVPQEHHVVLPPVPATRGVPHADQPHCIEPPPEPKIGQQWRGTAGPAQAWTVQPPRQTCKALACTSPVRQQEALHPLPRADPVPRAGHKQPPVPSVLFHRLLQCPHLPRVLHAFYMWAWKKSSPPADLPPTSAAASRASSFPPWHSRPRAFARPFYTSPVRQQALKHRWMQGLSVTSHQLRFRIPTINMGPG